MTPGNTTRRPRQDRTRVSLEAHWEIMYWTTKFACTEAELRRAVHELGSEVGAVQRFFANRPT